jgi:hypothetical protein
VRRALVALVAATAALSQLGLAPLALTPAAHAGPPSDVDRWALIIGIDHFQGRTRPNVGAVGDARDFANMLTANGFPADHIRVLTDGAATAAGIRDGLRWLQSHATPRTFSVFHYSGHTKLFDGDRDRDGERIDEYLWPHDNSFISDAEASAALRAIPGWLWADFSGCEAAGFDDKLSGPNRLVTGASQENEKAYEHPKWQNSVFTGLLADQGVLQKQADANNSGRVSITEAFAFAARRAPEVTANQHPAGPQHPYIAGGDGSEWFLQAPPPPPAPAQKPAPSKGGKRCSLVVGTLCL